MRTSILALLAVTACRPPSPCRSADFAKIRRYSAPYAGHWTVVRGDTLTLPDPSLADRFRLAAIRLDTDTVAVGRQCLYGGSIVFSVPRADTLAVKWFGVPERVTIFGWPADLGPFGGLNGTLFGPDSLRGAILFDERLGVRMPPGVTAQFVAGRTAR